MLPLIFTFFNPRDLVVNSSLILVICSCLINCPITFSGLEQAEFSRHNSSFFYMISAGFIHVATFSWWLAAWSKVILFTRLGRDGAEYLMAGVPQVFSTGPSSPLDLSGEYEPIFTWWLGPKNAKVETV